MVHRQHPTLRLSPWALLTFCFLIVAKQGSVLGLDNGLGLTPPMGWNSWNHFHCAIHEDLIKEIADALVSTGLRDLGYTYLNLDDCWQLSRDATTGKIQEDPDKFPSGMKALGNYIHSKHLKYGLYSDAGMFTCQRRPGSLGKEGMDAQSYAEFGADYLKYDNCFAANLPPQPRYEAMRDALNATGRPIFFSICNWGWDHPETWAGPVGNSWRTTTDINDGWHSVLSLLDKNDGLYPYAGPGHWNDPDMLEVGNGGLTHEEERSHFTMWAIMKAPLLLGNDITNITKDTMAIIGNRKIISINQDPLGAQAYSVWSSDEKDKAQQIWAGPLAGGDLVVVLFNRGGTQPVNITVPWKYIDVSPDSTMVLQDLWCDDDDTMGNSNCNTTATGTFTATVAPHDVAAFRMSPVTNDDVVIS